MGCLIFETDVGESWQELHLDDILHSGTLRPEVPLFFSALPPLANAVLRRKRADLQGRVTFRRATSRVTLSVRDT